ncbi:MAG: hypothetical protein WDN24_10620 [Sphingomonas sp.]
MITSLSPRSIASNSATTICSARARASGSPANSLKPLGWLLAMPTAGSGATVGDLSSSGANPFRQPFQSSSATGSTSATFAALNTSEWPKKLPGRPV